jgi:hypothetical protein
MQEDTVRGEEAKCSSHALRVLIVRKMRILRFQSRRIRCNQQDYNGIFSILTLLYRRERERERERERNNICSMLC